MGEGSGAIPVLDRLLSTNEFMAMNEIVAEFIGTFLLILLGNGVFANVLLNETKGHNSGWIVIPLIGCLITAAFFLVQGILIHQAINLPAYSCHRAFTGSVRAMRIA